MAPIDGQRHSLRFEHRGRLPAPGTLRRVRRIGGSALSAERLREADSCGILQFMGAPAINGANEASQIRLALGQGLDYQHRLAEHFETVHAAIALEAEPADSRWQGLCERHGVTLRWNDSFERLF